MSDPIGSVSIYLLPGMRAKLTAPSLFIGFGERKILQASGKHEKYTLKNGFAVYDETIGSIDEVSDEPAVIYTHKKFAQNIVYFYARSGEIGEVNIISVPIHDHSSIVTGGPAYGTYFTDDETENQGDA